MGVIDLTHWHSDIVQNISLVNGPELKASKSVSELAGLSATLLNLIESKLMGEL